MKFSINSKEFKSLIERAAAVSLRDKKAIPALTGLFIVADKDKQTVTVEARNEKTYAEVHTENAVILESGYVFAQTEDLKRLYNIPDDLTVESQDGESLLVRGGKKQGEVAAQRDMERIAFPDNVENFAFTADKEDMLDTLSRLSVCTECTDVKHVHRGYHIEDHAGLRIVTVNSHTAGIRETEWDYSSGLDIVIPGWTNRELKKVSDNKRQEKITVYSNSKFAKFTGTDYTYCTGLLDGEFLKIDRVIGFQNPTYRFDISTEKLGAIAKEYKGFLLSSRYDKNPMFFCFRGDRLITAGESSSYRTTDVLDTDNEQDMPESLTYGINPALLEDVLSVFGKKEDITITGDRTSHITPWIISDADGYKAVILPVRPLENMEGIYRLVDAA